MLAATAPTLRAAEDRLITWGRPGPEVPASPNYRVVLRQGTRTAQPFVHLSRNAGVDKAIDREGRYIKLSFLALHSNEPAPPEANRDTHAVSWTQFDFAGGPVEVEVQLTRAPHGVNLPLKSCAVLPSDLGIACRVVGPDTVRFTLTRPAKIALVPNRDEAAAALAAGAPRQALEGYRHPLFIFARAPESDAPPADAPDTLVVTPDRPRTAAEFARATVIRFAPGVHDYSRISGDPDFYFLLRSGQTVHVPGDAYVFANFKFPPRTPVAEMPLVRGRGTVSGARQRWTDLPYITTVAINTRLEGIQISEPHNHLHHSTAPIRDIAVVGAWHGNTDGPTVEARRPDPFSGWHIDDCFIMAADTNVKLGGAARARHLTLWQQANAEPLWIRAPERCVVENLHVLAYHVWPANPARVNGQVVNLHTYDRGAQDCLIRNLTIEAPFVPLLFFLPANTTDGSTPFRNVVFENIVVRTPHIAAKSPVGSTKPGAPSIGRIVFRNLVINGVRVTAANCTDYFELRHGVTVGRELIFE